MGLAPSPESGDMSLVTLPCNLLGFQTLSLLTVHGRLGEAEKGKSREENPWAQKVKAVNHKTKEKDNFYGKEGDFYLEMLNESGFHSPVITNSIRNVCDCSLLHLHQTL